MHSSFISKKLRSQSQMLLETSTFTTILLVFTVHEVCYISNKYQPPNTWAKHPYFYSRNFISLIHFEKILVLSIANIFQNIHFLPHSHYFYQWVRFVIFQINTDVLINKLQKYFYTKHLTLLFYSNKKFVLSIAQVFRNTHFLPNAS